LRHEFQLSLKISRTSRLAFRLNGVVTGAIAEVIEVVIITISAVHSVNGCGTVRFKWDRTDFFCGCPHSQAAGCGHKFGSDNPPPCAVSRNCGSSGERKEPTRNVVEVMGVILDASFLKRKSDLYAFPLV
jgi:hypothetical protein